MKDEGKKEERKEGRTEKRTFVVQLRYCPSSSVEGLRKAMTISASIVGVPARDSNRALLVSESRILLLCQTARTKVGAGHEMHTSH
jgi:hypothetical protein